MSFGVPLILAGVEAKKANIRQEDIISLRLEIDVPSLEVKRVQSDYPFGESYSRITIKVDTIDRREMVACKSVTAYIKNNLRRN